MGGHDMGTGYQKYAMILCWVGMMLVYNSGYGADWYVTPGTGSGGDGRSWATAFKTIQQAVDACSSTWNICAGPTDQIHVMDGTYLLTSPISVSKFVTILGGYNYKGNRYWKSYHTIIDGQNMTRCFNISGPSIIDGFVIQYGLVNTISGGDLGSGGGLYIHSAPTYCAAYDYYNVPKIRNCMIRNNRAFDGGGIYDYESDSVIENCTFEGNSAGNGGAVRFTTSSVTFNKCIFRNNNATGDGGIGGGAIIGLLNNPPTTAYIINCLFDGNTSDSWGGAIATSMAFPRIMFSTFYNNHADISGGAYHNNQNSDAPSVSDSIFWENSPDQFDVITAYTDYYVSRSDVQGGWSGPGEDNIDENPDFVSSSSGDFHLELGSPCIDADQGEGIEEDLDGVLRPHDGDGDGTAAYDMGAYEFYRFTLSGDFDWDWDVDGVNLSVFGGSLGSVFGDAAYNASLDFDENGSINGDDLNVFAGEFGKYDGP
jgi:hypothetical protein